MMSHPIIFSHHHPKAAGIIGDTENNILNEVVKHHQLTDIQLINSDKSELHREDFRVKKYEYIDWAKIHHRLDIFIALNDPTPELLQHYFNQLNSDGILIQAATSPFDAPSLKALLHQLKMTGFQDSQILHFPQPNYPSGWRVAVLALKHGVFKRLREKDIYNKAFKTQYYNFDIHRASLVLPEFMRETII